MADKRILIVGINYAPEHGGIAPYTTAAAEHLARSGHAVLVLTGVHHYPSWTVPADMRFRLRQQYEHNGVVIRRLRHHVPHGTGVLHRGGYEATFGAHVTIQRLPWAPDVVLAVVPSLLGAIAAARIARRHNVPLVVWLQDRMGRAAAQSGVVGGTRVAALVEAWEVALLRRARSIVTIDESFSRALADVGIGPNNVRVVRNWSKVLADFGDRRSSRTRLGWADNTTVVMHAGNMGLKQNLDVVVDAAVLAGQDPSADVVFVLMGDGSQRSALEARAREASAHALHFMDPVPEKQFSSILKAADILLVNERPGMNEMSLPSKLTSYFQVGLPILAAVEAGGPTARQVTRSGGGVVIAPGDASNLYSAVKSIRDYPDHGKRLADRGIAFARVSLDAGDSLGQLSELLLEATQV